MPRRQITTVVLVSLVVASCAGGAEPPDSRPGATSSIAVTSTLATTTTTTPVPSIDGAPDELVALVDQFYRYATGRSSLAPPVASEVLDGLPLDQLNTPSSGVAAIGTFKGSSVATVEMGDDLFLAVDDGSGWRVVGGRWPSLSVPAHFGPSPRLVAVVGSDARPGEDVDRTRADSIHFIGLDGMGGGAVVGLPRDAYVPIPDFGKKKITSSLALGGPDTMLHALKDLSNLQLEGYLLTGFEGFDELIDSVLGGVEVEVPFDINDKAAKAVLSAGLQVLNGFDALAFARARKTLRGGDFTRSFHQGEILVGAAKGARALGFLAIPRLMADSEQWLITDLDAESLLTLSAAVLSADLENVPNLVVPGSLGTAGGASVVFLTEGANEIFEDLADGSLNQS